ncbi:uncharacterized protein [Apostichopus japonicus]|uniref:uncharacterized protein n=1 Tax=Stichopus japonicus TaxID=307972 RepID=UPI003AB29879
MSSDVQLTPHTAGNLVDTRSTAQDHHLPGAGRDGPRRVFLWSIPRSRSTVFVKCMSFVENVQVWYEPYLYSYHNELLTHPDSDREQMEREAREGLERMRPILEQTPRGRGYHWRQFRYDWVKSQLEADEYGKDLIFVKDSAFAIDGHYRSLPSNKAFQYTFIIRDPRNMFLSYKNAFMNEVGELERETFNIVNDVDVYPSDELYKKSYKLWKFVIEQTGRFPVVIDGDELATYPDILLPKYFRMIGIPFKESYLRWERHHDVIRTWKTSYEAIVACTQNGWITQAAHSSAFSRPLQTPPNSDELPDDIRYCVDQSMPYYRAMYRHRLKV